MSDVVTSDLERGRYFGFPPYIKYREYCGEKQYESFNDLKDVMREEVIITSPRNIMIEESAAIGYWFRF